MKLKRILSLLLALVLLGGSFSALAAWSEVRLVSARSLKNHYILYDYGDGSVIDSLKCDPASNYAAWQKMSDSDKREVTRWFAGYTSQLVAQFGKSGAAVLCAVYDGDRYLGCAAASFVPRQGEGCPFRAELT